MPTGLVQKPKFGSQVGSKELKDSKASSVVLQTELQVEETDHQVEEPEQRVARKHTSKKPPKVKKS